MQISGPLPNLVCKLRVGLFLIAASSAVLSGAAPFLWVQDGHSSDSQTSALRFEVASIKPADPETHQGSYWRTTPAGDIYVHSVPMLALIMSAYGLQDFQVLGYPAWVGSESFDVEAKSGEDSTAKREQAALKARLQARLRSLLAERCQLVARTNTKSQLAWVLTVDPGGLRMHPAGPDPGPTIFHPFAVTAGAMTMAEFSAALSNIIHGVVADQTGLVGTYKVDLRWSSSPETLEMRKATPGPDVPEIPGALREQLGLRLTKRNAIVDVLIVEGIQRPSAN
jgi:uncharacterized protein (TIGR03435 family)